MTPDDPADGTTPEETGDAPTDEAAEGPPDRRGRGRRARWRARRRTGDGPLAADDAGPADDAPRGSRTAEPSEPGSEDAPASLESDPAPVPLAPTAWSTPVSPMSAAAENGTTAPTTTAGQTTSDIDPGGTTPPTSTSPERPTAPPATAAGRATNDIDPSAATPPASTPPERPTGAPTAPPATTAGQATSDIDPSGATPPASTSSEGTAGAPVAPIDERPADETAGASPTGAAAETPTGRLDRLAETPAAPAMTTGRASSGVATPRATTSPERPTGAPTAAPRAAAPAGEDAAGARRVGTVRFRLERRVKAVFALAVVLAVVLTTAGAIAFLQVLDARDALVDRADPGLQASSDLLGALVDQETGIRAYVLSSDDTFLEPYQRGANAADDARARLDRVADLPGVRSWLEEVDRAVAAWRQDYAEPTLDQVQAGDRAAREEGSLREGRVLFDDVRAQVTGLQDQLTADRADARDRLNATTVRLLAILALTALVVAAIAAFLWQLMRRRVQAPLQQLSRDAEQIAGGDLVHPVEPVGPAELQALGAAMEQMRQRIVDELEAVTQARDALERQTGDLARSNAELEQFAYVASHDLQEPLRKVASFCQLLQSRYGGQLDERADQYIKFAVDGAKRMQALINDLLAFSRVGRNPADTVEVRAGQLVDEAVENLSGAIEETDARVTVVGPLPWVRVETSLGVALFQNLVSNALKFRRPGLPPSVHISARRSAGFNEFTVSDEGIGIEPAYAERIFVIFQRLHARDDYGGTGIGLALCRKIVEGHGGRIWVDTGEHAGAASGTTIRFTLPVVEGDA